MAQILKQTIILLWAACIAIHPLAEASRPELSVDRKALGSIPFSEALDRHALVSRARFSGRHVIAPSHLNSLTPLFTATQVPVGSETITRAAFPWYWIGVPIALGVFLKVWRWYGSLKRVARMHDQILAEIGRSPAEGAEILATAAMEIMFAAAKKGAEKADQHTMAGATIDLLDAFRQQWPSVLQDSQWNHLLQPLTRLEELFGGTPDSEMVNDLAIEFVNRLNRELLLPLRGEIIQRVVADGRMTLSIQRIDFWRRWSAMDSDLLVLMSAKGSFTGYLDSSRSIYIDVKSILITVAEIADLYKSRGRSAPSFEKQKRPMIRRIVTEEVAHFQDFRAADKGGASYLENYVRPHSPLWQALQSQDPIEQFNDAVEVAGQLRLMLFADHHEEVRHRLYFLQTADDKNHQGAFQFVLNQMAQRYGDQWLRRVGGLSLPAFRKLGREIFLENFVVAVDGGLLPSVSEDGKVLSQSAESAELYAAVEEAYLKETQKLISNPAEWIDASVPAFVGWAGGAAFDSSLTLAVIMAGVLVAAVLHRRLGSQNFRQLFSTSA